MKATHILCLAALATLASCNQPKEDLAALEASVEELQAAVDAIKKKTSEMRLELQRVGEAQSKNEALISSIAKKQEATYAEAVELTTVFMHYRNEYRDSIRQRAPGMKLEDFDAAGKQFKAVEVKEVDDWELSFKHSNGFTRIDLKDAPPELRILFAYNPNVGPKPEKPLATGTIAAAGAPGAGMGGAGGGSSSFSGAVSNAEQRYALAAGAGSAQASAFDPFSSSTSLTVGGEMGERQGRASERLTATSETRYTRVIKLPDGSLVEVMTGY